MLTFGLIFSFITCKVIVCSLTHIKSPMISNEAVLMLVIGLCMKFIHGSKVGRYDFYLLCIFLAFVLVSILDWVHGCVHQITRHLGISCFTLQKRPRVPVKDD